MPTFTLVCNSCGNTQEEFDNYANIHLYRCHKCQSDCRISPAAPVTHFRASAGEVRRAEVAYTDEDGKRHVTRLSHLEGKQYNPDNKKFKGSQK